jgi:hypothetical protein
MSVHLIIIGGMLVAFALIVFVVITVHRLATDRDRYRWRFKNTRDERREDRKLVRHLLRTQSIWIEEGSPTANMIQRRGFEVPRA